MLLNISPVQSFSVFSILKGIFKKKISYTKSLIAESIVAFVAYATLSKGTASINVANSGLCSNYANDLMLNSCSSVMLACLVELFSLFSC